MDLPEYSKKPGAIREVLLSALKSWAFTLSGDGMRVYVHSRSNVMFVRDLLIKNGHDDVAVSFF